MYMTYSVYSREMISTSVRLKTLGGGGGGGVEGREFSPSYKNNKE